MDLEQDNFENEIENTYIYPHSVTISAEGVKAKEVYDEFFGNSSFLIYISIYSRNLNQDYIIDLAIIDINGYAETTHKMFYCDTLDSEEGKNFIKSLLIIFKPFKRNILNFENRQYSMKEYYSIVENWVGENKSKLVQKENLDNDI